MGLVLYLTHPEVAIDPAMPVPRWGLSPRGRARAGAFAALPAIRAAGRFIASDENKAIETASILAGAAGREAEIHAGLHENDRSATGFLPPAAFEAMADRFFAEPEKSAAGWERAIDAQARIVRAVEAALVAGAGEKLVVLAGHGGVGTLLLCHLGGVPIDRARDQPPGGGHYFIFERGGALRVDGWQRMETDPAAWLA